MGGKWYGFLHRALLFGSAAVVLRYNGFSRIVAVLANMLFGLPIVNYFGDCGFPIPSSLSADGLSIFRQFCGRIGVAHKEDKTKFGGIVTLLGLWVSFRARPAE